MTTETPETHVITDLPAPKRQFRNPFAKKSDAPADTNETTTPTKGRKLHGVYTAGVLLVAAGAVAAVASKFGKSNEDAEVIEISSDTTDVA